MLLRLSKNLSHPCQIPPKVVHRESIWRIRHTMLTFLKSTNNRRLNSPMFFVLSVVKIRQLFCFCFFLGHYIPQLTVLLLDYNRKPNVKPIKLKSIAVMSTLPLNFLLINCFIFESGLYPMTFAAGESTTRS